MKREIILVSLPTACAQEERPSLFVQVQTTGSCVWQFWLVVYMGPFCSQFRRDCQLRGFKAWVGCRLRGQLWSNWGWCGGWGRWDTTNHRDWQWRTRWRFFHVKPVSWQRWSRIIHFWKLVGLTFAFCNAFLSTSTGSRWTATRYRTFRIVFFDLAVLRILACRILLLIWENIMIAIMRWPL